MNYYTECSEIEDITDFNNQHLKQQISNTIRKYAITHHLNFRETWNTAYKQFFDKTDFHPASARLMAGGSKIDCIAKAGLLPELLMVVKSLEESST